MKKLNISIFEPQSICEAKICGCIDKRRIVYSFNEPAHNMCIDRKQLILSQIQACKTLLKHTRDKLELCMVEKEIDELNAVY